MRACNGCPLHLLSEALKFIGRLVALPQHVHPRWAAVVMGLQAQALDQFVAHRSKFPVIPSDMVLAQQVGDSERGPFDHGRRKTACVASTISSVMLMNLVVVVLRAFRGCFRSSGEFFAKLQIPFFMIKQSNDMIALIDGHDQRL